MYPILSVMLVQFKSVSKLGMEKHDLYQHRNRQISIFEHYDHLPYYQYFVCVLFFKGFIRSH